MQPKLTAKALCGDQEVGQISKVIVDPLSHEISHVVVSDELFDEVVLERIEFPADERDLVEELIRHHLRAGQYDGSWTDSAVRRFHREMAPFLRDLLDLSRADVTSQRPGRRKACLAAVLVHWRRWPRGRQLPVPARVMQALFL